MHSGEYHKMRHQWGIGFIQQLETRWNSSTVHYQILLFFLFIFIASLWCSKLLKMHLFNHLKCGLEAKYWVFFKNTVCQDFLSTHIPLHFIILTSIFFPIFAAFLLPVIIVPYLLCKPLFHPVDAVAYPAFAVFFQSHVKLLWF